MLLSSMYRNQVRTKTLCVRIKRPSFLVLKKSKVVRTYSVLESELESSLFGCCTTERKVDLLLEVCLGWDVVQLNEVEER